MTDYLDYDYLLIGHGIAGAVLARELRGRGHSVLVYDEPRPDAASRVAAGLMNPVAGKRFALTWRAHETLPTAVAYYQGLNEELGEDFFQPSPILKVFGSLPEQEQMLARAADDPWQGFVERIDPAPIARPGLLAPFGGAWLRGGGHLRVAALLAALARQGKAAGWLREETFSWEHVVADGTGVAYAPGQLRARHVVCCQGAAALACPHFGWLPLTPNQGAVLDVAVPGLSPAQVLNRGAYVVPSVVPGQFRVGATYRWPPFATEPGDADQRELAGRLAGLTALPFEVLSEQRGVRPAVRDRRPLLGRHPALPWLSLFGGFGSKGVSMAPRLATLLADHLASSGELWPDVNLARYYALYPALEGIKK
ncbi:FAD-binding oxidoreductase [Hymenobacter sp. H14-R3]|uniref:NAD(P)/FAD-dependent oxidoreductase n=1 Tax=Hymenobacter sp. H14-R3 TaxID=3046308 RepID=UPI0024BA72CF|nr:FAD-binding oxidoreductase [Hymenobacter sp. H14-R3]MDJ0363528.1 FAD-binding oxidoreductase [Hymenobacter sp. H14-R3]